MGRTVLPKSLIEEIRSLQDQGFSSMEIFDTVREEAGKIEVAGAQLGRCIAAIGRKVSVRPVAEQSTSKKIKAFPLPKSFDTSEYKNLIKVFGKETNLKQIEKQCRPIVLNLLTQEGFRDVQDVNQIDDFSNPPFDFFGFKKGEPYLIEFKGSVNHFHTPGETQKRRLQQLLKNIRGLHVALLQIKLSKGEYRIFYDDEMELLFDGPPTPLAPVEKWIRSQLTSR
jgi:hypothetical protein